MQYKQYNFMFALFTILLRLLRMRLSLDLLVIRLISPNSWLSLDHNNKYDSIFIKYVKEKM